MAQGLDVVVAGLSVVDVIGRPVDFAGLPRAGGLQLIDTITLTTGGNVPNYAIDLARLGVRVGVVTRLGNDELGVFVRNRLRAERVAVDGVIVDRKLQTSSTFVAVHPDGERSFLHTRGCMRNFTARDVLAHLSLVARARWLAFGYLGLLPECEPDLPRLFSAIKRRTRTRILLDTGGNPARSPSLLRRILPWVDVFVPSYEEAAALTDVRRPGDMVAAFRQLGATGIVGIKLGAEGCYLDHNGEAVHIPAQRVRSVVDTTGAGDAFVAGFLAATVRGFPPAEAARIATRVAASCVTAVGASTAIRSFTTYQRRRPS